MKTYLEASEIDQLEQAAINLRDRLMIQLLYHLGCRISEALALSVNDIDFQNNTVAIQHLKTRLKLSCPESNTALGKNHTYCPRCGIKVEKAVTNAKEHRRFRTLPLDGNTRQMLLDYIQQGGPVIKNSQQLIFGITRHRAWQVISQCAQKAGLPQLMNPESGRIHRISPHRLRDAFAVHAMKINESADGIRMLQEHLGHASFNTTAKYRKVAGDEHKAWYAKLWVQK